MVVENTPQAFDDGDDEHVQDVQSDAASVPEVEEENGDEESGSPAPESEVDEGPTTPVPQPLARKKKLGRPPKNRPTDWDQDVEPASESGTPRRGRGRGAGRGGGYGRRIFRIKESS